MECTSCGSIHAADAALTHGVRGAVVRWRPLRSTESILSITDPGLLRAKFIPIRLEGGGGSMDAIYRDYKASGFTARHSVPPLMDQPWPCRAQGCSRVSTNSKHFKQKPSKGVVSSRQTICLKSLLVNWLTGQLEESGSAQSACPIEGQ